VPAFASIVVNIRIPQALLRLAGTQQSNIVLLLLLLLLLLLDLLLLLLDFLLLLQERARRRLVDDVNGGRRERRRGARVSRLLDLQRRGICRFTGCFKAGRRRRWAYRPAIASLDRHCRGRTGWPFIAALLLVTRRLS
jgi:hypothetical protein